MNVLAQFFLFAALTLVPDSLPLVILLAALITFGNFGERFELFCHESGRYFHFSKKSCAR